VGEGQGREAVTPDEVDELFNWLAEMAIKGALANQDTFMKAAKLGLIPENYRRFCKAMKALDMVNEGKPLWEK
jgi:dihydrodipicolinate synthase/N-acetylneuraminate lyase